MLQKLLFQINADLWIFLLIKRILKKLYSTVLNIDNNNNNIIIIIKNKFLNSKSSDGSCDTEDWRNDAENLALITEINYILK